VNTIALQSQAIFADAIVIDLPTNRVRIEKRREGQQLNGRGTVHDGRAFGLYARNSELFVFAEPRTFSISQITSCVHSNDGTTNCLTIITSDGLSELIRYPIRKADPIDVYTISDEEDVDFFLWLDRTIHSPERQKISLQEWPWRWKP
jgi:hypothetical protein